MSFSKKQIRQSIRHQRRSLTPEEQAQAASDLLNHFRNNPIYKKSKSIAIYLPNDGELDLTPLLFHGIMRRKRIYVPVIHGPAFNRMWFAPINSRSEMKTNRFGIAEPKVPFSKMRKPSQLDLVLLPLVAFDDSGNRLGMGGGFYDRSFSFIKHRLRWKKPMLVGVAHDFQQIEQLPAEPWDIPLDAIATNTRFIRF